MLSSSQTELKSLFDSCNYYAVLDETEFDQLSTLMEDCGKENAKFGADLEKDISVYAGHIADQPYIAE